MDRPELTRVRGIVVMRQIYDGAGKSAPFFFLEKGAESNWLVVNGLSRAEELKSHQLIAIERLRPFKFPKSNRRGYGGVSGDQVDPGTRIFPTRLG